MSAAIGIQRERPLHASLKRWYAQPGDLVEVDVDGFVIDLVRNELLIEIQTRGFAGLSRKAHALLDRGHRVRVVHPIAVERTIVRLDADGVILARRRSPRHEAVIDVVAELVSFPDLLANPRFEIELVLTRQDELRRHEPGRCWRRRGWTVVERRLVEVVDRVVLAEPVDLTRLLPDGLPEEFTTAELAMLLGRPRRLAQQLAYCLRTLGLVEVVATRQRAAVYRCSIRGG